MHPPAIFGLLAVGRVAKQALAAALPRTVRGGRGGGGGARRLSSRLLEQHRPRVLGLHGVHAARERRVHGGGQAAPRRSGIRLGTVAAAPPAAVALPSGTNCGRCSRDVTELLEPFCMPLARLHSGRRDAVADRLHYLGSTNGS